MRMHQVEVLLMGGQACVLYGAAEFSRDTDFVLHLAPENLDRLQTALEELRAEVIAVPPFEAQYLARGHAVHFRCQHPEAMGLRIDLMAVLRGVSPFPDLWHRRTTVEVQPREVYDLLALPDLVAAKKTQRDKDWPMIRRLLEANYFPHRENPAPEQIDFWLRELRTPQLLIECAGQHSSLLPELMSVRPLLSLAAANDETQLASALQDEENAERAQDRAYWAPLRRELEELRRRGGGTPPLELEG